MRIALGTLLLVISTCGGSYLSQEEELLLAIKHDADKVAEQYRKGLLPSDVASVKFPDLDNFDTSGNLSHLKPSSPESVNVQFLLYNRNHQNTPVKVVYNEDPKKIASNMKGTGPLVLICHGFGGNSDWGRDIKNELLTLSDADVLMIDWSKGATAPDYQRAAGNTRLTGRVAAHFVAKLVQLTNLTPARVHFIGFSLGGQVAGFFGEDYQRYYKTKIGRLTALDPAAPLFEEYNVHIRREHGTYVDVLHTSAGNNILSGKLGMTAAVGHVDYYPNGGKKQPSCGAIDFSCSHSMAPKYFVQSVHNCHYESHPCSGGWEDFKAGKCRDSHVSLRGRMGHHSPSKDKAQGKLYLITSKTHPYC